MWDGTTYTDRIYAAEDGAFTSGRSGLIAYVHIVGYKAEGVSPTFDNFYSGTDAPPSIACPADGTVIDNAGACQSAPNVRQ